MTIDVRGNSEAQIRTNDLLKTIADAYEDFDYYKNTTYSNVARPAVFWPNGTSIGYGYASHLSGSAKKFYAKFKYWGFDDLKDFYCLPIEKRNEFLENGKAIWEAIFREEFAEKTLEDILKIDILDNQRRDQALSSLAKAEEAFRNKLSEEAWRIKNECYSNRRLRWRIRNEKARFKAEDKLRDRTQSSYSPDFLFEAILTTSFRFQERIKSLVGFRERFPSKEVVE